MKLTQRIRIRIKIKIKMKMKIKIKMRTKTRSNKLPYQNVEGLLVGAKEEVEEVEEEVEDGAEAKGKERVV